MDKKYDTYTANDFLKDEDFLLWRLTATKESDEFWENYICDHPEQSGNIEQAIRVLNQLRANDCGLSDESLDTIYDEVVKKASGYKRVKRISIWSAAACMAVVCALSAFLYESRFSGGNEDLTFAVVDTLPDEIQLIVEDKTIVLAENAKVKYDENGTVQVEGKTSLQEKHSGNAGKMNQLIVPAGKRTSLTLADGTKVWLNSGTTLSFPSVFDKGERRIRVNGEIYIEVTKDAGRPFIVQTNGFDVRVLGTQFNITAYAGDAKQSVVLVEGSVLVNAKVGGKAKLVPNEMLVLEGDKIEKQTVDVENFISWKDGILQFRSESLHDILQRISRYYGVPIEYGNIDVNRKCTGELVLFDDIESVLRSVSGIYPISYTFQNNKIMIDKP